MKARGFTLIEALIAVLVLSIGLLGIAGLQLASLQTNSVAYQRSQATMLAYDLLDRMRANRTAALNGAYDRNYGDPRAVPVLPPLAPVAVRDMNELMLRLDRLLPAGSDPA
ncbi:MAG: type IV pilus modification protein PilV, partial [Steroidobacteraceae bacterium]|nr:type IV pilus modification protein PilV [Steroidobacteraceae bacterium]